MCGITGFYNYKASYMSNEPYWGNVIDSMMKKILHRGPDDNGTMHYDKCFLAHTRLSIIDLKTGHQPMAKGNACIVYNGEVYNLQELIRDLKYKGHSFDTTSDTEVLLECFLEYGPDFVSRLNGIFAIAIYDISHETLYLFRDHMGVKPLYYTTYDNSTYRGTFIFASEMKSLFKFPGVSPHITRESFCEVFGTGPAKTSGKGVFANVREVLPASYLAVNKYGINTVKYWRLKSAPHYDSYEDTLEKISSLVSDAIKRQMVSDVPIAAFLSGGLDSSLVTSICARELKKRGQKINTFSFDFIKNNEYFTPSSFQPAEDRPYVEMMVKYTDSNHHFLECSTKTQADLLFDSVISRDLPTMADVDSSLLYFCSLVKDYNKVVLTGECADEIFGGYPWFHRDEFLHPAGGETFCFTPTLAPRKELLNKDFLDWINLDEYVKNAYETSVKEIDILPSDNETEANRRKISYINLRWFMQTLLDRMDRTSMYNGLEARVPFADYRIVEYVFNVPWSMKARNGVVKNLLREAAKDYLPDEILYRKKSPYPKTYNPEYEELLGNRLKDILHDAQSPLHFCVDKDKVLTFIDKNKDYGKPWYGQLMAGPQMMAYLIQVNTWLSLYR